LDCNATLLPDECELSGNDCNQNGIPDECDLSSAASDDCNDDSIPDECQTDCNFNGLHDLCDVDSGESNDCNANLIPDECEADCNLNDIEDSCDILAATSNEVDNNGVPDECCPPPCGPPALLANPTGLCSGSGAACDVPSNNCPAGQTCVPWKMNRFISFSIPTGGPSQQTAIRVKLTYLHRPSDPAPPNTPNFSAHEGHYRYVNLVRDAVNNAFLMCSDSAVPGGSFPCARLGCTPEYRNWASSFGGSNVYVYGDAVVPDSTYQVARLGASCLGNEPYCTNVSPQLAISTSRWGNIDNSSAGSAVPNAIDLGLVVTKVKNSPGALIEPRCMLREGTPDPLFASVSVLDAARAVEALKGLPYPFQIGSCP
jgi:hypothetical protein